MAPAGFEPAFPASERSQTDSLNCAATVIGVRHYTFMKYLLNESPNKTVWRLLTAIGLSRQMTDFRQIDVRSLYEFQNKLLCCPLY
jgi:hypothetical protein